MQCYFALHIHRGITLSWVCVHGYDYSPYLVNGMVGSITLDYVQRMSHGCISMKINYVSGSSK